MKPSKREIAQIEFLHRRGYLVQRRLISVNGERWRVVYDVKPPSFHNLPHAAE